MHVDLSLKDANIPLHHRGHEQVSEDLYKIRNHFTQIKKRISTELDKWLSEIFDQVVKKTE